MQNTLSQGALKLSHAHMPQKPRLSILAKLFLFAIGTIVILFLGAVLVFPGPRSARPAMWRTQCFNNLKTISIALHRYHDEHGRFPPAYTVDETGKPLHSWRTLILPYLDDGNLDPAAMSSLYDQLDLSKPWDDPHNANILRLINPACYRCPANEITSGRTTYLALVFEDSVLRPEQSLATKEIENSASQTVMIIEVPDDQSVPWMKPVDADLTQFLSFSPKSRLPHQDGFNVAFADGACRYVSATMSAATRKTMAQATQPPAE